MICGNDYIRPSIETALERALPRAPVVALIGARQAGKTNGRPARHAGRAGPYADLIGPKIAALSKELGCKGSVIDAADTNSIRETINSAIADLVRIEGLVLRPFGSLG